AQIREILISESAWEEMTCLFAPSLGELSFSIYLLHLPAKEFIYMIGEKLDIPTMKTGTIYVLLSIAVTILASFLTRRYIEIKLSSRIKKLIIPKVQTKSPLSLQQS
ncbi:hypothetical protein VC870_05910, partial [Citrobacter freundii]|nr:hypothetical protein [Citrobacter freundii]